jgi:hypothetical protein
MILGLIAVRGGGIYFFGALSGHFRALSGTFGQFRALFGHTLGHYRALSGTIGHYRALSGTIGHYRAPLHLGTINIPLLLLFLHCVTTDRHQTTDNAT